jgi:hypothetical protein
VLVVLGTSATTTLVGAVLLLNGTAIRRRTVEALITAPALLGLVPVGTWHCTIAHEGQCDEEKGETSESWRDSQSVTEIRGQIDPSDSKDNGFGSISASLIDWCSFCEISTNSHFDSARRLSQITHCFFRGNGS